MNISDEYHHRCLRQVPAQLQEFARELGVTLLCDEHQGHQDWIAWVPGEPHFCASGQDAQEACATLLQQLLFGKQTDIESRLREEIRIHLEKMAQFYDDFGRETDLGKGSIYLRLIEKEKGIIYGLQTALQIARSPLPTEPITPPGASKNEPD